MFHPFRRSILLAIVLLIVSPLASWAEETAAPPADWPAWVVAFEYVCGKVSISPELPDEDLRYLMARSVSLETDAGRFDVPERKVYLFRLKKCRAIFQYTMDLRRAKGTPPVSAPSPKAKGESTSGAPPEHTIPLTPKGMNVPKEDRN